MAEPTVGSPSRAVRAGVGAAVAVVVAVSAHAAAHGGFDPRWVGWTFLALLGPSWWAAGRRRSWAALAASQLAGQQLAHVVLGTAGPDAVATGHLVPTDAMLYAHLLGAALSATWLLWGERRAWAAARRWAAGVLDIPAADAPPPAEPVPARITLPGRARPETLRHAVVRRGPPVPADA